MERADVSAHDPRVVAILTDPDEYFSRASLRAWAKARDDIAADVNRRARERNGNNRHEERATPSRTGDL